MGGGSYSSYDYSSRATSRSAKDYARDDNREYSRPSKGLQPPIGKEIVSKSKRSLVFLLDVTGSMSEWPRLILEKLPTLYVETNNAIQGITPDHAEKHSKKLEEALDISIIAIGDERMGDDYPIQVTDFVKYGGLQEKIKSIYPEGGGGGNAKESYDLAIYYVLNHCKTKDKNPICIIAEDEGYYDYSNPDEIKKYIGDNIDERIKTKTMLQQLSKKFQTYVLRKYYSGHNSEIEAQWKAGVGNNRVIEISDAKRLVDAAIVAAAHSAGQLDAGLEWIKRRQTESQISEIEHSFRNLITKQKKKKEKNKNGLDEILDELHPFRKKK